MSTRTLQRRLTGEGATFQQLMEDARREFGSALSANSSLELNETAYLLGYEDANPSFVPSITGKAQSPGEWRTSHAKSARTRETETSAV